VEEQRGPRARGRGHGRGEEVRAEGEEAEQLVAVWGCGGRGGMQGEVVPGRGCRGGGGGAEVVDGRPTTTKNSKLKL